MLLTQSNLPYYLVARGLLSSEKLVQKGVTVFSAGRRHRNFKALTGDGGGIFIKQGVAAWADGPATLQREAAFYSMVKSRPSFEMHARVAPRILDFDATSVALALELLDGRENLTEYHLRMGAFPVAAGRAMGTWLGKLHLEAGRAFLDPMHRKDFRFQPPWILLQRPSEGISAQFGGPAAQMNAMLASFPNLLAQAVAIRELFRFDCVSHGDIKWDNLLIGPDAREESFRIIDWELVDAGDSSWDVASMITSYISFAFWSATQSGGAPEDFRAACLRKLEEIKPALRAFWAAYIAAREVEAPNAAFFLERCVRFLPARLIVNVFECLYNALPPSPNLYAHLQLAQIAAGDPRHVATEMLGMA